MKVPSLLLTLLISLSCYAQDAKDIVRKADEKMRGATMYMPGASGLARCK